MRAIDLLVVELLVIPPNPDIVVASDRREKACKARVWYRETLTERKTPAHRASRPAGTRTLTVRGTPAHRASRP